MGQPAGRCRFWAYLATLLSRIPPLVVVPGVPQLAIRARPLLGPALKWEVLAVGKSLQLKFIISAPSSMPESEVRAEAMNHPDVLVIDATDGPIELNLRERKFRSEEWNAG